MTRLRSVGERAFIVAALCGLVVAVLAGIAVGLVETTIKR